MAHAPRDLAQIRFDNAMALFDEFVRATARHADAATLRGLEGRFAERLQIQPSYWSQIKARSRQIGERLARQFEQLSHKPAGWLDEIHASGAARAELDLHAAHSDDERFIVELVLTYYRRHPELARSRLLELLGEAMQPGPAPSARDESKSARRPAESDDQLWSQTRAAVAPLKRKR